MDNVQPKEISSNALAVKSCSINKDFYGVLKNLSTEQLGLFTFALIRRAEHDNSAAAKLDDVSAVIFTLMTEATERISAICSANGAKGGRPPLSSRTQSTSTNSLADKDTDYHSELDNYLVGDVDTDAKTAYGINGFVLLSRTEYESLLSSYDKAALDKGIQAVDSWVARKDKCNITDWPKFVRKAIDDDWSKSTGKCGKSTPSKKAFSSEIPDDSAYESDFI
jgi:hypothetical protein